MAFKGQNSVLYSLYYNGDFAIFNIKDLRHISFSHSFSNDLEIKKSQFVNLPDNSTFSKMH